MLLLGERERETEGDGSWMGVERVEPSIEGSRWELLVRLLAAYGGRPPNVPVVPVMSFTSFTTRGQQEQL